MTDLILKASHPGKLTLNKDTSFNEGYNQGYPKGYEDGHNAGYLEGNEAGYTSGVEDGKIAGTDAFWDVIQENGTRIYYQFVFSRWGCEHLSPKYMIAPEGAQFVNAFQGMTKLKTVDWTKFDLSKVNSFYLCWNSNFALKSIDTELSPQSVVSNCWNYTFSGCWELERIKNIRALVGNTWLDTFNRCDNLTEIRFAPYDEANGIGIGNDISFTDSPNLTRESIVSILEALANNLNTDGLTYKTLTFSTGLEFIDKMRDCVFGLYNSSGASCGNVMVAETGTINGLEYRKSGGEITLNGTATADTTINLSTTPIVFPEWEYPMSYQLCDCYGGGLTDYLRLTVQRSDGTVENYWFGSSYSIGDFESGDTITSIDLVIPAGQSFGEALCGISCYIDYLYWIEETLLYRSCWNIVY